MTDYAGKVRSYLISVDDELRKVLSGIDEEDLFVDKLKEELGRLEEAEEASLVKAGDEIVSALEGSREEKILAAKGELDASARELAARWEAAESAKKSLKAENRVRDAYIDDLKRTLSHLRQNERRGKESFSRNVNSSLDRIAAAADEDEKRARKESAKKVAGSILAYKKNPQSQMPMSELLPIDRSVSRIYQQMSYLVEG